MRKISIAIFLASTALAACSYTGSSSRPDAKTAEGKAQSAIPTAVAELKATQGNQVTGKVTFTQAGEQVEVVAKIENLSPGSHGFHIHEFGDCSAPDATSAGGHFNPAGKAHGGPEDEERHSGDLGNLVAGGDGTAELKMKVSGIRVNSTGINGIIGRSVIVHANADDLKSQPVGNAGARVACGVIVRD